MPLKALTDAQLKKAKPQAKEYTLRDPSGLIFRVLSSGRKLFGWRCRDARRSNKQVRVFYGDYPDLSLAQARQIHSLFAAARNNGADIQDANVLANIINQVTEQERPTASTDGWTFKQLVDYYFQAFVDAQGKNHGPFRRLKNHLVPILGDFYVDQISEQTVSNVIEKLKAKKCSERTMADTFLYASMMFDFACDHRKVKHNPFKKNPFRRERKKRTAFYTLQEIRLLLTNPQNIHIGQDYLAIMKLLFQTGCRRNEIIQARRSEVILGSGEDGNYGRLSITSDRMKNMDNNGAENSFDIPLSKEMASILRHALDCFANETHVFGSKRFSNTATSFGRVTSGPLCDRFVDRTLTRYRKAYGLGNKCNHDMRRTLETTLGNLFYPDDVVSLMTGHKRQGMTGVYNQSQKVWLLRRCFQYWSSLIEFICTHDEQYAISFDECLEDKYSTELISRFSYSTLMTDMQSRWDKHSPKPEKAF
ncbi:tyrosine-type recombinase/integrase [Sansalvadorimonas verongulae]|uniref:tyrosine-type recombinase/integrase n=1 Tax=Sansalvadorimonas verongulae TaxID=2172824 RepID=UPI0012BB4E69|nr:integrase arm-type DNA-binding domain-containing protein [Sansalvadorimonas verongulae]MTI13307.1 DUF4102 domain-containing protein [Sansalvadorimonas verongulae]